MLRYLAPSLLAGFGSILGAQAFIWYVNTARPNSFSLWNATPWLFGGAAVSAAVGSGVFHRHEVKQRQAMAQAQQDKDNSLIQFLEYQTSNPDLSDEDRAVFADALMRLQEPTTNGTPALSAVRDTSSTSRFSTNRGGKS